MLNPDWLDVNRIPDWLYWIIILAIVFKERIAELLQWRERDQLDRREHEQRQDTLATSYHLAEAASAQQVMAELVANSQERAADGDAFLRERYVEMIKSLEILPEVKRELAAIKFEQRNHAAQIRIMVSLVSEMYEAQFPNNNKTTRYLE
jgi:hypothetical protein